MEMDSFCRKNKVPESVKNALKARYGGSYIYILGDKFHISNEVKRELAKYGHVERIPGGENIYNQAVSFATYKDVGKNFSCWFSKKVEILVGELHNQGIILYL